MLHSCPKCSATGDKIITCDNKHKYYLKCLNCAYVSEEYKDSDTLRNIWPVNNPYALYVIFDNIRDYLDKAEKLHPHFAEGQYEALGYLSEEHGEVVKAITKGKTGWEPQMDEELYELIAVAIRMLRREYVVATE